MLGISILLSRNLTTCTFSSSCCFAYTCIQLISSDLERGVTREDVHNSPEAPQASPHPAIWRRSNHITFDSDGWSTTTSNTITKYTEPRPLRAKLESYYERVGASRSINSVDELLSCRESYRATSNKAFFSRSAMKTTTSPWSFSAEEAGLEV